MRRPIKCRKVSTRALKPFETLKAFKVLEKRAAKYGLKMHCDGELCMIEAIDGLVFNDSLSYDTVNYHNRTEALDDIKGVIEHVKDCRE
jgi:hypothetical protein